MPQLFTPSDVFGASQEAFASSMKNLQSIGNARRKLEQERDELDFKKKEQNLKLEKMRREGRMSEIELNYLETALKEDVKQQKSILDGKNAEIGLVEKQTRDTADGALQAGRQAFAQDPQGIMQQVAQNQSRRTLTPVYKNGRLSLEVVDAEKDALEREKLQLDVQEKRKKASGKDYTQKDVVTLAKQLAGEFATAEEVKALLPEVEKMLSSNAGEIPTAPKTSQSDNTKVKVKAPDGRKGYIPKANLEKAKQSGYTVIE